MTSSRHFRAGWPLILLVFATFIAMATTALATTWQATLQIKNGGGLLDSLVFGVHPDATPGIDGLLGEVGLPPWPPSALFEARFMVTGSEGVKFELQDTTHTQRVHTVAWQAGSGGYPVVVRWDILSLPYAALSISDGYGGIFIPPINMYEVDSLVVPAAMSFITQLSVSVIPGVKPNAFPFVSPLPDTEIFLGQRFPDFHLDEYVLDPDTPDDDINWIATGQQALNISIDVDRVMHIDPPGSWTGSETITLTASDPEAHAVQRVVEFGVKPAGLPSWNIPVTVRNGVSEARVVQFGIHPDATDGIDSGLGEVSLPPWPPSSAFDARFLLPDAVTYSKLDRRKSVNTTLAYLLKWQAGSGGYPVSVEWPSTLPLGSFSITDEFGGVFIPLMDMGTTNHIVIGPDSSFLNGLIISTLAVVDTTPPQGPGFLVRTGESPLYSVDLFWPRCIEDNFAYYEVLYDTVSFDQMAQFVWDWSEDGDLLVQETTTTTVLLPFASADFKFRIRAWDTFGNVGALSNVVTGITSGPTPVAPLSVRVRPNPFSNRVEIEFEGRPDIAVYDVVGRLVANIPTDGLGSSGSNTVFWYGKAHDGARLPSGVYFVRSSSAKGVATRKVVLIR